jgi:enoyl-CoA hydratase/carnithine racemase
VNRSFSENKQNGVLRLTIDRPKLNVLNFQIPTELKSALNQAVLRDLSEVLDNKDQLQDIASRSVEHQEGVRAFLAKRPARFYA